MRENLAVNWNPASGAMTVHCGEEMIARIAEQVLAELPDALEVPRSEVKFIHFCRQSKEETPTASWADSVGLVGCAIVSILLLIIFAAGISQIAGWFSG